MRLLVALLSIFVLACNSTKTLENKKAKEFIAMQWLQSEALTIQKLKGRVILLRWWTDECQYCINTSYSLNHLNTVYKDSGLVIIGIYHPKPEPRVVEFDEMQLYIAEKGFKFPIAIDADWKNLNNYWLSSGPKDFTSVSFLIDKKGVIRFIHPGGEYHLEFIPGHEKCVSDYHSMDSCIQVLLREGV